ncbi:MAG: hypothetical protein J1E57_07480 [Prevotella sp.]|nr:hypothetical protein [Prevotella sp.]
MKKQLATILMMLPLMGHAQTESDTTFVYGDKQIVVNDTDNGLDITVMTKDGDEYKKAQETNFVDGKEVTKIYVTSPFLSNMWTKKNDHRFVGHIPAISFGTSTLLRGLMAVNRSNGMNLQTDERNYEITLGTFNVGIPLNRQQTFGLSTGLMATYARHQFNEGYGLYNDGGIVNVRPIDELGNGETLKYAYLSYWAMRFPLFFEFQNTLGRHNFFFTFGVSFDWRYSAHSRVKTNKRKITPTNDINLNPVGVSLEMQWGYSQFAFFMRTSLTPIMNTNFAPKAYPMSMGIALLF